MERTRLQVDARLAALRIISTGRPQITAGLDLIEAELHELRAAVDAIPAMSYVRVNLGLANGERVDAWVNEKDAPRVLGS